MSPSGGTTTVVDQPMTWSPVKLLVVNVDAAISASSRTAASAVSSASRASASRARASASTVSRRRRSCTVPLAGLLRLIAQLPARLFDLGDAVLELVAQLAGQLQPVVGARRVHLDVAGHLALAAARRRRRAAGPAPRGRQLAEGEQRLGQVELDAAVQAVERQRRSLFEVTCSRDRRQSMSGLGANRARSSRRGKRRPTASVSWASAWRVTDRAASARGPVFALRVSSGSVSRRPRSGCAWAWPAIRRMSSTSATASRAGHPQAITPAPAEVDHPAGLASDRACAPATHEPSAAMAAVTSSPAGCPHALPAPGPTGAARARARPRPRRGPGG